LGQTPNMLASIPVPGGLMMVLTMV